MKRYVFVLILLLLCMQVKATTFQVTNTNATGVGSLEDAMWAASFDASATTAAPHIINFSNLPVGANTFVVAGQLPIQRPLILDGATHPSGRVIISAAGANVIPINIYNAGSSPAGTRIRNVVIINSNANGIQMDGVTNVRVENCYIGVLANGITASGVQNGVMLFNGANAIQINNCVIAGNKSNGVLIFGATTTNNTINGCKIGVTAVGNAALANGANGIQLSDGANTNQITNNVIAANASNGVFCSASTSNTITGNKVGVGFNGNTALGNGANGIQLIDNSSLNTFSDNIISANKSNGISIVASTKNTFSKNIIGATETGLIALANVNNGVEVLAGSDENEFVDNVISANGLIGLRVDKSIKTSITGNNIGVGIDGLTALGNVSHGVQLFGGSNESVVVNNVIAANGIQGLSIENSNQNTISNNKIGVGINGTTALGQAQNGIQISGASNNAISGNTIANNGFEGINLLLSSNTNTINDNSIVLNGAQGILITASNATTISNNVVSGNGTKFSANGVFVNSATGTILKGNKVGLSANGITKQANNGYGVHLSECFNTTIGGNTVADRNIIAANTASGVILTNSSGTNVLGNFIGVDVTGNTIASNGNHGVEIKGANSFNNNIGDVTFLGRNVISGNGLHGVYILENAHDNAIYGNYIGTDSTGNVSKGNGRNGISGEEARNTIVGGTTTAHRNVISGNGFNEYKTDEGPYFSGISQYKSVGLTVKANYIGLGADGETIIPNANYGIWYLESDALTVGGTTVGERNVISGNGSAGLNPQTNQLSSPVGQSSRGIYVETANTVTILGNYIGTNALGTVAKPNLSDGVVVINSSNVTIGGTSLAAANVISGNTHSGLYLNNNTTVSVQNNILGLGADGKTKLANGFDGVYLNAQNNASILNNTASGNSHTGIHLYQSNLNAITSNLVGTSTNKTSTIGNTDGGIRIVGSSAGNQNKLRLNTITGSTGANAASTIGNGYGIYVAGATANQNSISENAIYCNAGLAINLQLTGAGFGATAAGNNGKAVPVIIPSVSTSTSTSGTGVVGDTIQLYANPSKCGCGGEVYLGKTVVAANGKWQFTHPTTDSLWVSALAIAANGNTSQFACKKAVAGKVLTVTPNCINAPTSLVATGYSTTDLLWEVSTSASFTPLVYSTTTKVVADSTTIQFTPSAEMMHYVRVTSIVSPTERAVSPVVSWQVAPSQSLGNILSANSQLCSGDSVQLTVQNNIATSYLWSDSTASHGWQVLTAKTTASIFVKPSITTAYKIEPLAGECFTASAEYTVNVAAPVVGSVSLSVDKTTSCEGQKIDFTASANNVGAGATYKWLVDGVVQSANNIQFSPTSLSNGQVVQVLVSPDTACPSMLEYASNTIAVTVNQVASPSVSIFGDTEICTGDTVEITSAITGGSGAVNYSWFINGFKTDSTRTSYVSNLFKEGNTIRLVLYTSAECMPDSVVSNELAITASPTGEFTLAINNYTKCLTESRTVDLTASSELSKNAITYEWYVNGIAQLNNDSLFRFTPVVGDVITVGGATEVSCLNTDTVNSLPITIDFSLPVVANAGDDVLLDKVQEVELSAKESVNATNYVWQQLLADNQLKNIGFNASAIVVPPGIGSSSYVLTASNKYCSDTATVNVTLAIDLFIPSAFSPNKDDVNDRWTITNAEAFEDIEIKVFNRWGTLLYHSQNGGYTRASAWDGTYNGEPLPVATYYYIVDLHNGSEPQAGPVTIIR